MKSIIELAREAGMLVHIPFPSDTEVVISIERFAALVRAAALDEAAGVCENAISSIWEFHPEYVNQVGRNVCTNLAAAIRALKEQT